MALLSIMSDTVSCFCYCWAYHVLDISSDDADLRAYKRSMLLFDKARYKWMSQDSKGIQILSKKSPTQLDVDVLGIYFDHLTESA
jgi:hypothetical protein